MDRHAPIFGGGGGGGARAPRLKRSRQRINRGEGCGTRARAGSYVFCNGSGACCKKCYVLKRSQECYVLGENPTFLLQKSVTFLASFKCNIFYNRPLVAPQPRGNGRQPTATWTTKPRERGGGGWDGPPPSPPRRTHARGVYACAPRCKTIVSKIKVAARMCLFKFSTKPSLAQMKKARLEQPKTQYICTSN